MAANFQISHRKKQKDLHLRLSGDFDGSSAYELIHYLKDNCDHVGKIMIDTQSLRKVYPFGTHILKKNLHVLNRKSKHIEFLGKNAVQIAP